MVADRAAALDFDMACLMVGLDGKQRQQDHRDGVTRIKMGG